jgi:surface carbohydrate biosynthesis protein
VTEPIDILYFFEHKARELDNACVVKAILEQREGVSIEIASIAHGLEAAFTQYNPQVVVLPYCVAVYEANLDRIVSRWPQARYVNLAYEQVLGVAQKDLNSPKDDFARDYVIHHAWGEFFADYLKSHAVPEEHIAVNGNPTYALYRPPYSNYYGDARAELAARFGLDPEKRWVFVPENYGWAFFRDNMIRARIRRGFPAQDAHRYRDFARDSMTEVAKWWRDAAKIEAIELIVRPRPAVPKDSFIETVREMAGEVPDQLHIIKHGSVREWILCSDVVVSSYSTSLLEAAVAGKPIFMFYPLEYPKFLYSEWYQLVDQVTTKEAFEQAITQDSLPENWKQAEAWTADLMLRVSDPISNLADILKNVLTGDLDLPTPLAIAKQLERLTWASAYRKTRKLGWNLLQRGISLFGKPSQDQSWDQYEVDAITAKEIQERVSAWKAVLSE